MNTYIVKTLGCKANFYDSQQIESELQRRGWLPQSGNPHGDRVLCIVNSCTVTDEADRQSRKLASRLGRDNPGSVVVVTGCAAEVDPERLSASRGIHYVIGNRDKPTLVDLILEKMNSTSHLPNTGEILGVAETHSEMASRHPLDRDWAIPSSAFFLPDRQTTKTRLFLKIQEGCNSFCTYCIIPYGRGPSRSLRPGEVIAQIRNLTDQGVREIVLTGTNIGDYGLDWSERGSLEGLLALILNETKIERLRVSSLDPTEITAGMIELMKSDGRFCPHFHVSLQSPSPKILKLMKRKYGFEEVTKCLDAISQVRSNGDDVFVGMDVITGFPGETDEEFESTREKLACLPWTRLHVFPYSERGGTPATRLRGRVPQAIRSERTRTLVRLSNERLMLHAQKLLKMGRADSILLESPFERQGRKWISGYTRNYFRVVLPWRPELAENQTVSAELKEVVAEPTAGDLHFSADWIPA